MKIKIQLDTNDRLIAWGNANDNREVGEKIGDLLVIDQQDMSQLVENHAALIDGQIVLDEGYTEPAGPVGIVQPSAEQQMMAAVMLRVAKLEASS
ncbi:hypothetical protein ACFQ41_04910 [Lacticaseibacillus suilingensis]|uniref:Phage protein n=1 Tax=Lacticaseibacillus suilingensis TaxID=2799577 RepID=A0ABW4BFV6_9LACO